SHPGWTERGEPVSEILDLDRELQARTGLARDDYSYVNPTISSPDRLFWNAYRPIIWVYHEDVPDHHLFLSEQDDEEKARALARLGAPDLQDLETEYLHRLAELEPPVVEDAPDQVPGPDNHYGFYGPGVDQFLSAL